MSFPKGRAGGVRMIEFYTIFVTKNDRNYLRADGIRHIYIVLFLDRYGYSNICEIHWFLYWIFSKIIIFML